MKSKIAIISTWFPPNKGVAVNRIDAFATYLSEDYEVEVFTVGDTTKKENRETGPVYYFKSNVFLAKIKHKSTDGKWLHKFKTALNILAAKFKVKEYNGWKKQVCLAIDKSNSIKPFDIVISSFAPIEAHDVALEVKKKYPTIKWIADMRDEMGSNPFLSEIQSKNMRNEERKIAPYITAITTVSQPILDDFKQLFPEIDFFEEVRNGYNHTVEPIKNFNEIFTFIYAGSFYGKMKPTLFFKAIGELIEEKKISDFKIKFIGTNRNFEIPVALEPFVEFVTKVPYLKAIEYMQGADCNLLICPPFEAKGRFTGKVFDYLSVEKPILALIDKEDVAADLIEEHSGGVVCDFYDLEEAKNGILSIYTNWSERQNWKIKTELTESLHRKFQVDKLKVLIEKIKSI